jgi:signal transduction histidine kinase
MAVEYKNKRRAYRILFLNPRFQLKYSLFYAAVATGGLAIVAALSIFFLVNLISNAATSDPGVSMLNLLVVTAHEYYPFIGLLSFCLVACLIFFAYVLSKNIVGPMAVLNRHIEELRKGNYDHKTVLRNSDELKPLMHALNALSEALKERHSSDQDSSKRKSA